MGYVGVKRGGDWRDVGVWDEGCGLSIPRAGQDLALDGVDAWAFASLDILFLGYGFLSCAF